MLPKASDALSEPKETVNQQNMKDLRTYDVVVSLVNFINEAIKTWYECEVNNCEDSEQHGDFSLDVEAIRILPKLFRQQK